MQTWYFLGCPKSLPKLISKFAIPVVFRMLGEEECHINWTWFIIKGTIVHQVNHKLFPSKFDLVLIHYATTQLHRAQFTCNGENRITDGNMSPSSSLGGDMRFNMALFPVDLLF